MSLIKQLERIKYIDYLISKKVAISRTSLAKKLNISTRQLTSIINLMKELGAPIKYCKRTKKYLYTSNEKFYYGYKNISEI